MAPRNPSEGHRVATPLELLFDLCFVVAVAFASARLHHAFVEGHILDAIPHYAIVFFAIWWAWLNFTWFASAYDTDDLFYRLATMVQMGGVLVVAAGIPRAFDQNDFSVSVIGYVIMRLVMVGQWLRVARTDLPRRTTSQRYALGIGLCQVGWVLRLFLPATSIITAIVMVVLVVAELAVPLWAERAGETPWHPHHVAERYSLFTIIVLGESILAATTAFQEAFDSGRGTLFLLIAALCSLLLVFGMWWLCFDRPARILQHHDAAFSWGYGHVLIFAAAAAVGAGLQVMIDLIVGEAHITTRAAGLALGVPIALYLLGVWALHAGLHQRNLLHTVASPIAAILILGAALTPWPLPLITCVLVVRVAIAALDPPPPAHQQLVGD